jgi:hypothetical protein
MAKRRKVDHTEKLSQLVVKGMQEKKAYKTDGGP